ncbi:MAG: SPFH domain-containing protein [Oscillospiraceae bacterium]|nr:SPFH domain-containing protein [Oscillospiraceae bacterium]
MGLIKAALGAGGGVLADQWKEYFYCEALPADVLLTKGQKRVSGRSSNTKGSDNIISSGSVIAVADGQCMIIVEQGKVVEICAESGNYTFDSSTEPTIFNGNLSQSIPNVLRNIGKRFTFGGEAPKDQRVYYFNTKELVGNKYGTPAPVPFRVVDQNVGLDIDIAIRCSGEYSYRVTNPILFYTNVSGNVDTAYKRDQIEGQLKTELLTALQPAFAKISAMGVRYSMLPGHTIELADALNEVLSSKWRELRGIEIVSFGVSTVKASEEDEAMIKELQRNAAFRNPNMAAAHLVGAQATAMQSAAANKGGGGPAMAFMGMNMASNAGGMNAQNLFAMGQQPQYQQQPQQQYQQQPQQYQQQPQQYQQQPQQYQQQPQQYQQQPQQYASQGQQYAPQGGQSQGQAQGQPSAASAAAGGWTCPCGQAGNTGKFCAECGKPQPQPSAAVAGWTCSCGQSGNTGKFCAECGKPKPQDDSWTCSCGVVNKGKFCSECGGSRP